MSYVESTTSPLDGFIHNRREMYSDAEAQLSIGNRLETISPDVNEQILQPQQVFLPNSIPSQALGTFDTGNAGITNDGNATTSIRFWAGSTFQNRFTAPFMVTQAGDVTATSITISGGVIKYGKTSFTDNTHAGYYISSEGIYIGAVSDNTYMKYTVATAAFDLVGTISSRSTATIAGAINSSGNLITDLVNARLDSSSKKILSDFNFGTTNYAGAVNAGNVTWNTTTGAITGGSGVVIYRSGIVGVNSGTTTFSIDATTGNATFAGTLSAPTGNIGGFTINSGSLSATSGGNTTTVSSGSTAFSAGPTGSPSVTITQAGVLTATGAVVNGRNFTSDPVFGDGSDSGTTTISVDTTLTRDMFYDILIVNSSKTLNPNGFKIFAKTSITVNGTISRNGNTGGNGGNGTAGSSGGAGGTAGTGGASLADGSLKGSLTGTAGAAGGNGGNDTNNGSIGGTGPTGTTISNSIGSDGNNGTAGAAGQSGSPGGTGGAAGPAGTKGTRNEAIAAVRNLVNAILNLDSGATTTTLYTGSGQPGGNGGGGGGGGRSGQVRQGGGGGGSGGCGSNGAEVFIASPTITVSATGSIKSLGGNGGNGGNGGAGQLSLGFAAGAGAGGNSGGGGNGGVILLIYTTLTNNGTISVAGGSAGTVGAGALGTDAQTTSNSGNAGAAGTTGKIYYYNLS